MTTYVAEQKELLNSFREAARTLDREALEDIIAAGEFQRFDLLRELGRNITQKISCDLDFDLKSQFEGATCIALMTMMPNLEYIDPLDEKAMDDVIEMARFDILARYREIAVKEGLLPVMFGSGHQHANHTVSLDH